ncbi:MAG TPA: hypothetical protein VIY09_04305 [Rhizomicrobium sp.]
MRGISVMAASLCILLAGCDQNPKSNAVNIQDKNGSVTVSANGQTFTMKANDDKNGSFTMSAGNGHFTMKASDGKQNVEINAAGNSADVHMPGFAATYPGARVQSTTVDAGANGTSGSEIFETNNPPAAVIAYYRQQAAGAGLKEALNMNMGATATFTANADGGKKALQVIAASSGSGARVQVNWTGAK